MKILHITNTFSEGGVESLLLDILPRMVALGHQVDLLVLDNSQASLKDKALGVNVILGKYSKAYHPLNVLQIYNTIKRGNYDIVHSNLFPTQYFTIIAKWLLCRKKTTFITTEHNTLNNRRKYKLFKYLDRLFLGSYDAVAAITNDVKEVLQKWAKVNSAVIYNGINLDRFEKAKQSNQITRAELNIPQDATVLIMVARFSDEKDQQTIIKSLAQLDTSFYVLFIGTGPNMNKCKNLAAELNVSDRVKFIGYSSTPETYIKISDYGVLSSFSEGFGISAIEYMAMQRPTIVSDVEGMSEVVGDAAIKIIPQSVDDLKKAINSLNTDQELRTQMAQKAYQRAQLFDINKTVSNYLNLYNTYTKSL